MKNASNELTSCVPCCLWLTGLSGAGKSTVAAALQTILRAGGARTYILDGDRLRTGLNADLGFSSIDRQENIRRIAQVARLMVDADILTIVAAISPFRNDRLTARALFEHGTFVEIFIDTPLDVCAKRDPKGLYKRAFQGELQEFTGVSSSYEAPLSPEIHLVHDGRPLEASVSRVLNHLTTAGLIGGLVPHM